MPQTSRIHPVSQLQRLFTCRRRDVHRTPSTGGDDRVLELPHPRFRREPRLRLVGRRGHRRQRRRRGVACRIHELAGSRPLASPPAPAPRGRAARPGPLAGRRDRLAPAPCGPRASRTARTSLETAREVRAAAAVACPGLIRLARLVGAWSRCQGAPSQAAAQLPPAVGSRTQLASARPERTTRTVRIHELEDAMTTLPRPGRSRRWSTARRRRRSGTSPWTACSTRRRDRTTGSQRCGRTGHRT